MCKMSKRFQRLHRMFKSIQFNHLFFVTGYSNWLIIQNRPVEEKKGAQMPIKNIALTWALYIVYNYDKE